MSAPAQSNTSRNDTTKKVASKEYPVIVTEISAFDPKPVDSVIVPEKLREERRGITVWAGRTKDEEEVAIWADEEDEEVAMLVNKELCEIVSELCTYGHLLHGKDRENFEKLCDEAKELCGEE